MELWQLLHPRAMKRVLTLLFGAPVSGSNVGAVPINRRTAKTQLVVRDQQTVVIGGLMRDAVTTTNSKIPLLGDIPVIGLLFRKKTSTKSKQNLLLFMTPYIVRTQADLRASAALLVLENAAQRRQQLLLRDELKRRYLGRNAPDDIAQALQSLRAWLGDTGFVSRPSELEPDGYGLPQADERMRIAEEARVRVTRLREQDGALRSELERWLPADQREVLRGIEANLETIGARLRARDAAGAS